jgi:hypothetical protein
VIIEIVRPSSAHAMAAPGSSYTENCPENKRTFGTAFDPRSAELEQPTTNNCSTLNATDPAAALDDFHTAGIADIRRFLPPGTMVYDPWKMGWPPGQSFAMCVCAAVAHEYATTAVFSGANSLDEKLERLQRLVMNHIGDCGSMKITSAVTCICPIVLSEIQAAEEVGLEAGASYMEYLQYEDGIPFQM